MVFQAKFYEWELGAESVRLEERDAPWAPPSVWFEKAQARYGPLHDVEGIFSSGATPMRISAPTLIYDAELPAGITSAGGHGHGVITFDPYTGEPLAHFVAESTWAIWPYKLHISLFFGDLFSAVLTTLTAAALFFAVTGLILWWPRKGRWRASLKPARVDSPPGLRKTHEVVGACIAVFLVVFAASGFGLLRFDLATKFAHVLGRVDGQARASSTVSCQQSSMDAAWSAALSRNPGYDIAMFILPQMEGAPYAVYLRPTGVQVPTRGDAEVRVEADCARILFARDAATNRAGDVMLSYLVDLHNGRVLGLAGEILVGASGLAIFAVPLLGVGAWLWRLGRTRSTSRKLARHP